MADKEINTTANQEVIIQDGNTYRRSVAHLPAFYRTDSNTRFLSSTLDPLIQKGGLDRLDGFIGRQDAYTRMSTDTYVSATTRDRMAYQLEPAVTFTDKNTTSINPEDQVKFSGTYDDFINQIKYYGGKVDNHDRLNKETVYSWNPAIDLDKLTNYREYYWLPEGPNAISIDGVGPTAVVEIDVVNKEKGAYNFGNYPGKNNPTVSLYKGNTYKFTIDAKGHPFWIMTEPYREGVDIDGSTSVIYSSGVTNAGTDQGTVTFTVPSNAPKVLYYQCGNHDAMHGVLSIKDIDANSKIDVANDILGTKNYSLRTLKLSNGMKIKFDHVTTDETTYKDQEFYVEGVGDAITLTNVDTLITPESYATETTIKYDSASYDSRPYAKAFYRPETPDYITIKRDSIDQNAWSRYNRWFHKDIIETVGKINGFTANLDETDRAKRPIIEFDSGLELYNNGTVAKKSVTLIDTVTTDAFSSIVKQTGYIIDGISLADGMRVIFTNDTDPTVKNKIYDVKFVQAGDSTSVISLTKASDGDAKDEDCIFIEFGTKNQGKTFHYRSSTKLWTASQEKTKVNQQPLFGMWDNDEISLDDPTTYPTSSFAGAKVFSYKTSDASTTDTVLGIKVKYNTINNVGDIVFESDHTAGTFTYKKDKTTITDNLAKSHLHYTKKDGSHNNKNAWIKRKTESKQRVVRTLIVDTLEKKLFPIDFFKNSADITDLEVSVSVNGIRKNLNTDYTLEDGTTHKFVKFVKDLQENDHIKITAYSAEPKVPGKGIYQVPDNLSTNALNEETGSFTYGQILNHTKDIFEKNVDITGSFPGNCGLRDVPDAVLKGGTIQQHSGSLVPAIFGLIDQQTNVLSSIDYTNREYQQFYDSILTHAIGTPYTGDIADRLDEILAKINAGKTSSMPFFHEDMIGWGPQHSVRNYTVNDPNEKEYATDSLFKMNETSNRALYIYLNDEQLILGADYTVSTTDDSVNITATLAIGDKIKIKDYSNTTGSFVPPTPTKLGMYPKFTPEKYTDNTYITTTDVIRKHDGSIIKAYGDERDNLILELEKRIYNNLKTSYDSSLLDVNDVTPSGFNSTEYTLTETDAMLGGDFYAWAGRNGVQYISNSTFSEGSPFTYNFATSTDSVKGEKLPGYWRAIYKYFYDTDKPHTHPWEMLGHSEKPSDWVSKYGNAPYTSGNSVLWEAIATAGGRYGKPDITKYLPVDSSGNLKNPIETGLVANFDIPHRASTWKFGDQGPAETAWRRSSAYPFSAIKLLALSKPAKFFGLYFDNSRLTTNTADNLIDIDTGIRQRLSTAKFHLQTVKDSSTDETIKYLTAGYQPFVVNYLLSRNLDLPTFYYDKLKNLKVQLAYKLGGFTDKDNLKVLTDSVSPGSTNGSKFIPDENYKITFRTSNPVDSFEYSGILIEKNTDHTLDGSTLQGGYRILGYNTEKPYFKVYWPKQSVAHKKIEVAGVTVKKYNNYSNLEQTIPYGHVFDTLQDTVNFILGYEQWLLTKGFSFNSFSNELKETLNFTTSVKELLYWTTQNWAPGSAVTVSPGATGLQIETKDAIVGQLKNIAGDYSILDAGGRKIDFKDISTKRLGKVFDLTVDSDAPGMYNVSLNTVQKEHILLFDNKTVFSDIIFDPLTGFRQARLKLVGWKTSNWNGDYYAPGFVFDAAAVSYWLANTDYKVGDTVEYQGKFYVAKVNHNSLNSFIGSNWQYKIEKPAPQLIPNFDYKISQFNDFYDLESNNFDESQQSLAQHLIGYQNRDYLQNLFVNDVSQYKFYQGYIREKGTKNAIDKLLKAKYENQDIDLELFPEWMIRVGNFGNTDRKENIQIEMKDDVFVANPQSIELGDTSNTAKEYNRSVMADKNTFYYKPVEYTASTTFEKLDYSKTGLDRETQQIYQTAGYPRLSQVQHTAYTINDLINLDVNRVTSNDLVWIANKTNFDWDVLRLTSAGVRINSLRPINNATQLEIEFTGPHNLVEGSSTTLADYFAIRNAPVNELNQVYTVAEVIDSVTIKVDYNNSTAFLPALADGSTADSYGMLYKFVSVRLSSMDNVNDKLSYSEYVDADDSISQIGDKVYADADTSGLWKVYEKHDPYTVKRLLSPATTADQDFGFQVVARNDGRALVVSAPSKGQGTIDFMFRSEATAGAAFKTQSSVTTTAGNDQTGRLGHSLSISTDENFVVAGGPYTNTLGSDGSTRFSDSGMIKIFLWNPLTFKYSALSTRKSPVDAASQNYGWAHKISEPGIESGRSTPTKYLFVSAPGHDSDKGRVYFYTWGVGADGSTYDTWTQNSVITSPDGGTGKRFGHKIEANDNGDIIAISSVAPGNAGKVEIFVRTTQSNDDSTNHTFALAQTLTGTSNDGSSLNTMFGESMAMSKDGTTLIIGAPGVDKTDQNDTGAIYSYKWNADGSTNTYTLQQTIESPDGQTNMRFGSSLSINQAGTKIAIGASKFANDREMKFDNGETTFDLQDTNIVDENIGSGGVYTATMYNTKFVIDDRLVTKTVSLNDDFGRGVSAIDHSIIVGSPEDFGNTTGDGTVSIFDQTVKGSHAWKQIAVETPLMDKEKLGQAFVFNKDSKAIVDWLEYYDPVKGRILGLADREITTKSMYDPAVYNFGPAANTRTPWGEEHVGETWWDLSTAKWIWYEQGDQEYKTNNWGKLFPGSTIDIYEWTESTLLPSEWLLNAGSESGALSGISGTPLDGSDTEFTIKQKYSTARDGFVNYYYYWVRNKVTVPRNTTVVRKNSCSYVANLIENPFASQQKYFAITDANKLLLFNTKTLLSNDSMVLNLDFRSNDHDAEAHSVWKLVREGDKDFKPGLDIESRWWDSLVGVNASGDKVPDIELPIGQRYGNNIRPRQSWYVDRFVALKEIIDYANTILKQNQLANTISYANLNSEDPQPSKQSLLWDAAVDTYADLTYINTRDISGTVNYLVKADENVNGFWTIYQWDGTIWNRTKTQTYKTSSYYSLVDWYGTDPEVHEMIHDENTPIDKQVTFEYELDSLDLAVGKHVKVTSADTGGWKLFMKTTSGWTNVGTENGTVQLSTSLYDFSKDGTGFADEDTFDDNTFDKEPTIETRKILTALRDDLFINELSIYYNTLFFTGLRRVLSEQTYVDWMYKTSFINVKNMVRTLDQRKTYTVGTDNWVEQYINEVKPFHTKLREYKIGYNSSETQDGIFTDFDNPAFYDSTAGKIRNLIEGADPTRREDYPHKFWQDNHKKHVSSITLTHGGSGYAKVPTVTVLGGTTTSTGPFQLYATSNSGATSGSVGYYYPLFTSETNANIWDSQNGGTGTSHTHTFDEFAGTFYMPTSSVNHAMTNASVVYKTYLTPDTTAATAKAIIQNGSVTKITVTGIGANYTTTPTVLITGGASDGTTPSDAAKAYANLNNDLVRDINTTIKFDRISSTSNVVDWKASTSYAYGTLIRYNNELYKATNAYTSTTDFDDGVNNLYKVYGDEAGLSAADRTKGFYTPASGMPGNELSQLMSGVDYGGTMVTGLLFTEEGGWDKQGWYNFGWDSSGTSKVKTFYGDGSTLAFTFDTAPSATEVYTVYYDGVRQTVDTPRGDGSTKTFTLTSAPGNNVKVEFIPFDDDGVLTPQDDKTLDSIVKGGLFTSALGESPSDIALEGDEFVSPETSYAPEEAVPGQLFDTVDIKVYTSPESGVPFITLKNYIGNNSTTVYDIGAFPGTLASVTVTVDGLTKKLNTDYTIQVASKTITFSSAPATNSKINIKTFAISGENYRVLDTFTGDNETVTFTTSSRSEFNLDSTVSEIYVTQDGAPRTDFAKTITNNTVTITFNSPVPPTGALIQVAGFNKSTTSTRSFAQIMSNTIVYDGSTNRHTLTYPPGSIGPFSGLTIVEVNGRVLRGPDNTYYLGDGSTYTYGVVSGLGDESTVDPAKTITSASDVLVFVNGVQKTLNSDYTVDTGAQTVSLTTPPTSNDVVAISTLVDNQYYNIGADIVLIPSRITSPYTLSTNDNITVTTFNNALGSKFKREVLEGRSSGKLHLRFEPLSSSYLTVWLNGKQLKAGADYLLAGTTITTSGITMTGSDRIDVMYFALDSAVGATGFRIFKDMLNRTFYKRINKNNTTEITTDLVPEDRTITVSDETKLPEVTGTTPGVIFIDKERIEYFVKDGFTLSQLRRGTLGTGIKVHGSGAKVVDASGTQTIPYADTVYTNTFTGNGSAGQAVTLSQTPSSASELDIFIGGQRLLLTSEDGSTINYSVSGANVTLSAAVASGTQIKILHKKGQVWYTAKDGNPADGKGLQGSTSQQAKFIAEDPTNAPE